MKTITSIQAQQIIDEVPPTRKEFYADLFGKDIAMRSLHIYIDINSIITNLKKDLPREVYEDIFGVEYKTGDWVLVYDHVGKIECISGNFCNICVESAVHKMHGVPLESIKRKATKEEIQKSIWKQGELYWVWHKKGCGNLPKIRYSGDTFGTFLTVKGTEEKFANFEKCSKKVVDNLPEKFRK